MRARACQPTSGRAFNYRSASPVSLARGARRRAKEEYARELLLLLLLRWWSSFFFLFFGRGLRVQQFARSWDSFREVVRPGMYSRVVGLVR